MSTWKNVTGEDREVQIDGARRFVAKDAEFTVPDEFDSTLVDQPHFAAAAQTVKKTTEAPAEATEGDN